MKKSLIILLALLFSTTVVGLPGCSTISTSPKSISYPGVHRMSIDDLKNRLSDDSTVVIDSRVIYAGDKVETKIKGAVREDPHGDIFDWSEKYPKNKTYVLYCT